MPDEQGPRLLRALRHRNYRLFFGGQSVSLIGTWITRVATSWLVYRLTGSALLLGIVGLCGQIPTLLLSPVAGVLVDRHNRHRILLITQALSMLQSLALALLALPKIITVGEILGLQVVQGIISAFDTPARQSFIVDMIEDRADLPNAIALNSTMVNGSRIIGPSIGGVVIAAFGEGWGDAVHGAHARHRISSASRRTAYPRLSHDRVRPWGARRGPLPRVAKFRSRTGPSDGAIHHRVRDWVGGFSQSRVLWLSLLLLPVVGGGMMVETAATNTILQAIVEEQMRGRVMSFYTMAFLGTAPLGSLIAGVAADRIGAATTVLLGGIACVAAGIWFALRLPALRAVLRPIYVEKGILPY